MGWADGTTPITNDADYIDSREILARIEYLRDAWAEATEDNDQDYELSEDDWAVGLGAEDAHELVTLLALAKEAADYAPDWTHGETLIRDSYFTEHITELIGDCYELPEGFASGAWPWRHMTIDFEAAAEEAKVDYTSVDFDGVTYWIR